MNNNRPGQGQNHNRNKNPNNTQGQGVRPPNPNRHRRPPRRSDNNRFLQNRQRNPQASQNAQGAQGNNPNRQGPGSSFDKVFRRYEYLQEQHCIARRKHFENYYKTEGSQRDRAEKNFYSTLEQLRDYVSTLSAEQKEAFEKKYNGYPTDTEYSRVHGLPEQAERVKFADKFEDPHLLKSQTEVDFSSDTEESVGTIEDYNKYKGLT